jgi:hypothetical protein
VPAMCFRFSARAVHPDAQQCSLTPPAGPKLPCSPPQLLQKTSDSPGRFQPVLARINDC